MRSGAPRVAIVDFGLGNLFSVKQACEWAGLAASITQSPLEVLEADAVVLPGVGAFEDAMTTLSRLGMIDALRQVAASNTPLVGICLGMQLLMTRSHEFGLHAGLDIVPGDVVWLDPGSIGTRSVKRPQVCWNGLYRTARGGQDPWKSTLLDGLPDASTMYFSHSLCVRPASADVVIATTRYGAEEFCSALQHRNVFACQCHPERSGATGLHLYRNLAMMLARRVPEEGMADVGR